MVGFGLIIVSDQILLKPELDKLLPLVKNILGKNGHELTCNFLVSNDIHEIRKAFYKMPDEVKVVMICGGTGLGMRDVTIEAIKPLFDKELIGFGEFFRKFSLNSVGLKAIFSRCTAGRIDGKLVILLPGSPQALKLALENIILPQLDHFIDMLKDISHWKINYLYVKDDVINNNNLILKYVAKKLGDFKEYIIIKISKEYFKKSIKDMLKAIQFELAIESPKYILILFKNIGQLNSFLTFSKTLTS